MSQPRPLRSGDIDITAYLDEQLLVGRVRVGDPVAFEAIFRSYHRELCAVAERVMGSSAVAEDVVQEVFLSIWASRERWYVSSSLRAYLRRAVRNVAMRHHSKMLVSNLSADAGAAEPDSDEAPSRSELNVARMADPRPLPSQDMEAAAISEDVARAAATLTPRAREVFELSRGEGLSIREIAERLQLSPKTVEMHLTRALAAVRSAMARWR